MNNQWNEKGDPVKDINNLVATMKKSTGLPEGFIFSAADVFICRDCGNNNIRIFESDDSDYKWVCYCGNLEHTGDFEQPEWVIDTRDYYQDVHKAGIKLSSEKLHNLYRVINKA